MVYSSARIRGFLRASNIHSRILWCLFKHPESTSGLLIRPRFCEQLSLSIILGQCNEDVLELAIVFTAHFIVFWFDMPSTGSAWEILPTLRRKCCGIMPNLHFWITMGSFSLMLISPPEYLHRKRPCHGDP